MKSEVKYKINQIVHKTLGLPFECVSDSWDDSDRYWYDCRECGAKEITKKSHNVPIPDYVGSPDLWWPLAWELMGAGYCLTLELCGLGISHNACQKIIKLDSKDAGYTICKLWLEWKGVNLE